MTILPNDEDRQALQDDLRRAYVLRFSGREAYRNGVWRVLVADFFQPLLPPRAAVVLDLGCGWGEFINHVRAPRRLGMDLNPDSRGRLAPGIELLEQDCTEPWPLPDGSLDCVFTSNFFEHLRSKDDLRRTLAEVRRCLRPGGRLICLGPNVKYLAGEYRDVRDHHQPLTELSLGEVLELLGFTVERCVPRFLPYVMVRRRPVPLALVRLYLRLPWLWWTLGKQFLVVARAPGPGAEPATTGRA